MNPEETHWNQIVIIANHTRSILNDKPKSMRIGHWAEPGSILNAYREGDLDFTGAIAALEQWKQLSPVPALLDHLRDDAPFLICSGCGRKSWSAGNYGWLCGMTQPDGSSCKGRFQ